MWALVQVCKCKRVKLWSTLYTNYHTLPLLNKQYFSPCFADGDTEAQEHSLMLQRRGTTSQNKIKQNSLGQIDRCLQQSLLPEVFLTMILNNETHFPFTVNVEMEACARKTLLSFKILYKRVCTNLIKFSSINFSLFSASSLYIRRQEDQQELCTELYRHCFENLLSEARAQFLLLLSLQSPMHIFFSHNTQGTSLEVTGSSVWGTRAVFHRPSAVSAGRAELSSAVAPVIYLPCSSDYTI